MAIERLIREVSRVLEKGDQTKRSTVQKLRAYARQGCDLVPAFKQMFTRNLQLMFPVNQFIRVIEVVDRLNQQYGWPHTEIPYTDEYIQICRALYVSPAAWRRDQNNFYKQEYENRCKLEQYLRNIIEKHRKTLWVREELKYYTESLDELSIADVERHLKTLRKRISDKDTCFKDLVGYAWALEQGGETGAYHIHLLLIYNGSIREADWWHADLVGDLWEKITGDLGKGFNKHTAKERQSYKEKGLDGLGMVKREDD
ncbi:inovirus-type Gp2 protein, partial [Acinetobacter baumannii]